MWWIVDIRKTNIFGRQLPLIALYMLATPAIFSQSIQNIAFGMDGISSLISKSWLLEKLVAGKLLRFHWYRRGRMHVMSRRASDTLVSVWSLINPIFPKHWPTGFRNIRLRLTNPLNTTCVNTLPLWSQLRSSSPFSWPFSYSYGANYQGTLESE